ncbi:helix-turn-helix transcriptional regulator [Yinghuangia aomiensis]
MAELGKEPGSLPDGSETEIGHTFSELLVATLRWEENARPEDAGAVLGRRAQLLRMQDFVRRHLAEPDLSPRLLASAFGVSPRYVEVAFREGGLSPSRFIRETRLETAARVLADPRQRHRSIAAVARSVGIEGPSTFARMFRARYGHSPRDFRHAPFGCAAGGPPGTEGRTAPRFVNRQLSVRGWRHDRRPERPSSAVRVGGLPPGTRLPRLGGPRRASAVRTDLGNERLLPDSTGSAERTSAAGGTRRRRPGRALGLAGRRTPPRFPRPRATPSRSAGGGRIFGFRTIRARIVLLVLVPSLALAGCGAPTPSTATARRATCTRP